MLKKAAQLGCSERRGGCVLCSGTGGASERSENTAGGLFQHLLTIVKHEMCQVKHRTVEFSFSETFHL